MFNQYPTSTHCQHNIPAISCSICNRTQPIEYNQFETQIKNYEEQLKAYRELVKTKDKEIIELATKLAYANQTIENHYYEEPPKEQEPQYLYIYRDTSNNISVYHAMMVKAFNNFYYMGKVRVEK